MFNFNTTDPQSGYNNFHLLDNSLDTSSELDISELMHFGENSAPAQSVDMDATPLSSSQISSSELNRSDTSSSLSSNVALNKSSSDFFSLIQPLADLYDQCISNQCIQLNSPTTSSSVQYLNLLNQNLLEAMDKVVLDPRFSNVEEQQTSFNTGTISGYVFSHNIGHCSKQIEGEGTGQVSWCHLKDSRESCVTLRLIGQFDLEKSYINTALARIQLTANRHIFIPVTDTHLGQNKNITSDILKTNTLVTSIENKPDETTMKHVCISIDPITRDIKSGSDGVLTITQPDGTIAQWQDITFTKTGRIRAGSRGALATGTVVHMNGMQEQWQGARYDGSGHIHPGSIGTKSVKYPDGTESVWGNVTFESSGLIMSRSKGSLTTTYPDGTQKKWHDVTFDAIGHIINE